VNSRKIILLTASFLALLAGGYLLLQLQTAFDEYTHWRSREAVLEKELEDLRQEAKTDRKFLDRLRRDPDFQDAIARKELGYGKTSERLYRLPGLDDDEKSQVKKP
jgi:cell division protein FtsB